MNTVVSLVNIVVKLAYVLDLQNLKLEKLVSNVEMKGNNLVIERYILVMMANKLAMMENTLDLLESMSEMKVNISDL